VGDLLDSYVIGPSWDEMFADTAEPRPPYLALYQVLQALSSEDLDERSVARDRSLRDQGITFSLSGEERPFPLDLMPRIISAEEWDTIEQGVIQRVQALEQFLADVYGAGEILKDGIVPRSLVTTSTHFHRSAFGINPAKGTRIHVAGIDLIRDSDGHFKALEDNLRTPSGVSYVIENRRTMTRVFPELFGSQRIRPVEDYPSRLLEALRASAPAAASDDPTIVLLTPGVFNSAYFEHSFLARQMGVELVEGRDLVCVDGVVYMQTTERAQRVDVVYRRIDDEFLDPLHFRPDSMLGCPGILNAARAGNVTIANAVGNGVADDKLVYTYVPAMIRYYLGAEPRIANVETYHLQDPDQRSWVLERLDQLVLKPVDGSGGYGLVVGPAASDEQLEDLRRQVEMSPRSWIAQPVIQLSTAPTHVGGRLEPRHLDLRPFAVNDGTRVWVASGGLSRVALRAGSLVVNSSQGGGSKDTWVLAAAGPLAPEETRTDTRLQAAVRGAALDPGPAGSAGGQQQQQQQQQCKRARWQC
jgi:uncharacterized circularly permuted ATP-grasp superfamily protein